MNRPPIHTIFTPRSDEVNEAMYIQRPEHEQDLTRCVAGSLHCLICGESGSGKSWLYRHVAGKEGWKLFYSNSSNADRKASITEAIAESVLDESDKQAETYKHGLNAKAEIIGLGGGTSTERQYKLPQTDLLLRCFASMRRQAGDHKAILVIDNLEAIYYSPILMRELANIILLLDDPMYAKFRIKILIVGVPTDVVEYFKRTPNLESVGKRISEIRALHSLSERQVLDFVRRGFVDQLKVSFSPQEFSALANHVYYHTLGIAEHVHEYCEILGYRLQDAEWRFDEKLLAAADAKYAITSLKQSHAVIESHLNERQTKVGRRNQVIYALRNIDTTTFELQSLEQAMRKEFPESTGKVKVLGLGGILTDLCEEPNPLIRKSVTGNSYRFADPKYLMCIRVMLAKDSKGDKVIKRTLKR